MKSISICLSFIFCFSVATIAADFNITARIENTKSDSVLILMSPLANTDLEKMDTVLLKNGSFQYQMKLTEFYKMAIIPFDLIHHFKNGKTFPLPGSRILFFMNPGDNIKIDAKIEGKNVLYNLQGNKISEQLANSRKDKTLTFADRYEFEAAYNAKSKNLNTSDEEKSYMAKRGENNLAYQTSHIQYVKRHLDDEVSPLLLLEISNQDTVATLYQMLSDHSKASYHGKILSNRVKGWYTVKIGQKFLPLQANTIDGQPFKVGENSGKFMLLDFWGSWCKPCIEEIPALKVFHKRNENKLQLIGLLCKDKKEIAAALIKKNSLKWPQLYSEMDEFGELFGITGYPTKILVDPNGIVIKKFIGINDTMLNEIEAIINK